MKKRSLAPETLDLPQGVVHTLVALSGGADSVYLLYALLASGAQVTAAHFHHGLRAAADEDMRFCRRLCEELDVPLYEGGADVPAYAAMKGLGIETAARELRYRFLRNIKNAVEADVIALGHHMNDQAETVLMHLLRGSGLRGACGMARLEGDLYRPLLHLSKEQIKAKLEEDGLTWREDESNAVSDNPRNALRNDILPAVCGIYPGAEAALARFAEIARSDWQLLEKMADDVMRDNVWELPNGWRVDNFPDIDEPLLRRILMRLTGICDMHQITEMTKKAKIDRKNTEFTNFRLEPHGKNLYIIDTAYAAPDPVPFSCEGESVLEGLCAMQAQAWVSEPELSGGLVQVLRRDALENAVLRTRREGDRIHPLGAPGYKSLSDYLIDKKVPRPHRDVLPVLAVGDEILWVVGVGVSERVRIVPEGEAVRICCEMAERRA